MKIVDKRIRTVYNRQAFSGTWRSLVSRLVRVQEAPGSNPGVPTTGKRFKPSGLNLFFLYFLNYSPDIVH